jgi:hypothetical protein
VRRAMSVSEDAAICRRRALRRRARGVRADPHKIRPEMEIDSRRFWNSVLKVIDVAPSRARRTTILDDWECSPKRSFNGLGVQRIVPKRS